MNSTLNATRGLTCFPLGNRLNRIRIRTMKLGVFAQTSNSRCPSKSRHGRVSTDCNGIAGMIGIVAQNLGSRRMGAALSPLRHCFVRLRTLAITLFLLLSAYPARADIHQHPVLLPANVDPSKCLECHKDKATGKYVHTAVSMGCTVCHTVANVKGSTYISLSSPTDQLCVTCHKLSADPVQHPPYNEGNCGFCHSPHASNFPNRTPSSRTTQGSGGENEVGT